MTDRIGPTVSVIMPVYNVAPYLRQALDSILNQTYSDFELIAVDDGSTDESGKILDDYARKDSRVKAFHQQNQGVVAASNYAASVASGVYLARQDSDDISFLRRLELQVATLEAHPGLALVTGGFEGFDEDDEYIYREILPAKDEDIKRGLYLRNTIGHGSVMFRKDLFWEVGGYGANGDTRGIAEDYELFLRLATKGEFRALEAFMYRWRINTRGITSTQSKLMAQIVKEHINNLWATTPCPRVMSTRELRAKGRYYIRNFKKRGIAMKQVTLADNAQMAIKMIKYGHPLRGVHQLFAVMLVGRSGVSAVWMRFRHIRRGTAAAIRRKMWFH